MKPKDLKASQAIGRMPQPVKLVLVSFKTWLVYMTVGSVLKELQSIGPFKGKPVGHSRNCYLLQPLGKYRTFQKALHLSQWAQSASPVWPSGFPTDIQSAHGRILHQTFQPNSAGSFETHSVSESRQTRQIPERVTCKSPRKGSSHGFCSAKTAFALALCLACTINAPQQAEEYLTYPATFYSPFPVSQGSRESKATPAWEMVWLMLWAKSMVDVEVTIFAASVCSLVSLKNLACFCGSLGLARTAPFPLAVCEARIAAGLKPHMMRKRMNAVAVIRNCALLYVDQAV